MIDLTNTTFIIPLCIESKDREMNTFITLSYLCKYLHTNIIVYEYDKVSKFCDIIGSINIGNSNLQHIFVSDETGNGIFHRTKFLNEMLITVKTPVVVNYDIDILLKPDLYQKSSDLIINGHDLVYPYFWKQHQRQINYTGRVKVFDTISLDTLNNSDYKIEDSEYGHCQFFNTKSYISGGMENEGFISWAPEDQERGHRFKTLGYKVMWSNNTQDYVYHIEHTRGSNSSTNNPLLDHNNKLFAYIKSLPKDQLISYYKNVDYIKKY